MTRRRVAAALVLAAMAVLSGCATGGVDRSGLDDDAEYDFDRNATVTYDLQGGSYQAIVNVTGASERSIEVYRRVRIGGEQAVSVSSLQFRFANGTVVGADAFEVRQPNSRTVVEYPNASGVLAFTASHGYEQLYVPVGPEGSYEVILPRGMAVAAPVFGSVSPGGFTTETVDGRVHVRWAETPSGDVEVDYYLERDFYIFAGLVALLLVAGIVGVVYFRLQIRSLVRRREESGLELEE